MSVSGSVTVTRTDARRTVFTALLPPVPDREEVQP